MLTRNQYRFGLLKTPLEFKHVYYLEHTHDCFKVSCYNARTPKHYRFKRSEPIFQELKQVGEAKDTRDDHEQGADVEHAQQIHFVPSPNNQVHYNVEKGN